MSLYPSLKRREEKKKKGCQPMLVVGMIEIENHPFRTTVGIIDSGKNHQIELKSLSEKMGQKGIFIQSESIASQNIYEYQIKIQ